MFNHISGYFFGSAAKLWWIFLATGLFALVSPYILEMEVPVVRTLVVGMVAIIMSLALKLNYFGLQIDKAKSRMRDYVSIFGIRRGKWQPIPHFRKITLTSANVSSWNTPNGISPTFKSNITTYTIGLFSEEDRPQYLIQTENKNEALDRASQLSEVLGIEMSNHV